MGLLAGTILAIVILIIVIVVAWILFWWLYRRATKEVAFVRTGMGGQKVVQNGGAFVVPVLHDIIRVTMGTNRLEITRAEDRSIITRDRLRVDVTAEFYVRVGASPEAIALAAQSLGSKTARPEAMRELLEGRFVDALRTVAAEMTMEELHEQRGEYIRRVKELVRPEIQTTGLELESASLTALDQTNRDFFNPSNAFDAEGLTRLTADIEERRLKRNAIEQDSEISIQRKMLESETRRDLETARTQADEVVELARARRKEAVSQANIDADLAIDLHGIARSQSLTEQEHRRDIAIAESTKLQVAALADAETARLALVHAQGELERVREQEREEREQIVALIRARTAAERDTVAMLVQAEARFREAQDIAKANEVETRSKSDRLRALAEAEALAEKARLTAEEVRHATDAAGVRAMTEAENTMSEELMQLKLRLSVIDHLKDIIRESAKPMESISDIRIVQVDGVLGRGGLAGGGGGGEGEGRPAGGGGSLTDQVVDSALRYRAQAPVVDQLLADLGLKGPESASVAGYLGGHMAATPRSETPDKG